MASSAAGVPGRIPGNAPLIPRVVRDVLTGNRSLGPKEKDAGENCFEQNWANSDFECNKLDELHDTCMWPSLPKPGWCRSAPGGSRGLQREPRQTLRPCRAPRAEPGSTLTHLVPSEPRSARAAAFRIIYASRICHRPRKPFRLTCIRSGRTGSLEGSERV